MAFVRGGKHQEFSTIPVSHRSGFLYLLPSLFKPPGVTLAPLTSASDPSQRFALPQGLVSVMGFCEGISEKQILCFREA